MTPKKNIKIVILEDDLFFNKSLERHVQTICNSHAYDDFKFEISTYLNAKDCIEKLDKDTDILFLDYYLIGPEEQQILNGGDVFKRVREVCKDCKVVMVSSMKNIQTVVEMIRRGIYEFVTKNKNSNNRINDVLQQLLSDKMKAMG